MTLHWWMHWFWITRPRAVATQLILLLAIVQTVPLPASTLDPQVPSSHNSRIPLATDSDLEKDTGFENDKLTSIYIEEHRQTVVYEDGPVWSNSPDIEEPFYPTTASSDHLLNRDSSTENIPITSISISNDELQTKTHLFNYFGKSHIENENPIELTSQYFSDHSPQSSDIVQNYNIDKSEDSQDVYMANAKSASAREKTSSVEDIYSSTETHFISTTPKIIDNSVIINNHKSSNTEQRKESPNTESYSLNDNVSNLNRVSTTSVRKGNQRLVIRDLSNLSEPVLSSVVASQGNNSSSIDNASRPNPRASKAIGSFRNFSSSVDSKQRHIFGPEKLEGSEKLVHSVDDKENQTILQSDDLKRPDIQINNTGATPTTNFTQSSLQNITKTFNKETKSEIMINQKLPLESESSKLAPELSNKSVHSINITSLRKIQVVNRTGQPISLPISSTQNTSFNSSAVDSSKSVPTQLHSSESPVPVDSDLSQRFTTLSDTEESGNLTPAHSHDFIGRSASLSHDTETTVEPSIAPVSRSRLAASPQDVSHTGLDAASITGIALGIVVFAGLTGAVSFVLYRRRYLNKPQTLNDKCSNPDSSGYIDDSTLRDNSEEMYSLDNDSFLNSLEAMTIQNYWTDNVKHTKL